MLCDFRAVNQSRPKVELFPLCLADLEVVGDPFKVKRKHGLFVFKFVLLGTDLSFLSKLGLGADLMNFALFLNLLVFFYFNEELLCMGSNLGAVPGFNKVFYFFPVFSVELKTVEELFMFLLGPSASGFGLLEVHDGHGDI